MVEIVEEHSEAPQTSEVGEDNKDLASFTCEICIEPVSSTQKFQNHMKNCYHHSYCLDCIAKYIEAKLEDYNTFEIVCPGLECAEPLDPLKCQSLLPARVFDKWCDARCKSSISKYHSFYCPFRDCSALILNECGEKLMKAMCPNCKKWFCFECQVPWHAGYRCDETGQVKDRNDLLAGELIEKMNWKRCPACKHGVERSSGCPHMKCRCGESFCYTCGRRLGACECRAVILARDDVACRRTRWHTRLCCIYGILFCVALIFLFLFSRKDNIFCNEQM